MSRSLGATTVAILGTIQIRVCYGLDIIQRTGMLPGTVYTTLRRLERRGLVTGRWEDSEIAEAERRPRRKYYTLAPAGEVELEKARQSLGRLVYDLDRVTKAAGEAE